MALYGIFLIVLIPLTPAIAAVTLHPLLELREAIRASREHRNDLLAQSVQQVCPGVTIAPAVATA